MNDERAATVEVARTLLAWIGIALPFAIGCVVGDRSRDLPLEPRYAVVTAVACAIALAMFAQSASPRARRYVPLLLVPATIHVLLPMSAAAMALDVTALLGIALAIAIRASRRIRATPPSRARTLALVALISFAPGPLFTLGWGLVSTTLAPAITRVLHQRPEIGDGERAVEFASRDGLVIRGTFSAGREGAPGVLLVHGLADSRWRLVPWARAIASHGAHVLRIDLRAHGTSDGVAVTFADREPDDVEAALRFLAAQPGVGALHVLAVSMGGGASLVAISRRNVPVASTVCLAPASDFHAIVDRYLPPFEPLHWLSSTLVRGVTHGLGNRSPLELVPADDVVAAGPASILIIHSRSDTTVPVRLTESLVARAPWVEPVYIDGVPHVDIPEHTRRTPALRERVLAYLDVR